MKIRVYGFYDKAASTYVGDTAALVLFKHDAVAMRQFGDLCRHENSIFAKHPDDFQLHGLGEFDTESGELVTWVTPVVLASAAQVLEAK